jgi:hypothetical protein
LLPPVCALENGGCADSGIMVIVAAAFFVIAGALLISAALVWVGSVQPFPSSVRCNHAGVLGSAALFVVMSASLVLMVGVSSSMSLRLLAGGVWLLTFLVFLWMFLQTPNQWGSRMARAAEHTFDSRWSLSRRGGPGRSRGAAG